ncbi:MAG TPA: alpha/beta hydrolase [Thermomicrobiales bacterium]|jgi:pimeloyl-ACP methyl ester carboxylesterase|nr:alpha/beta hydrolase [Thermomicrobiales bacterium]
MTKSLSAYERRQQVAVPHSRRAALRIGAGLTAMAIAGGRRATSAFQPATPVASPIAAGEVEARRVAVDGRAVYLVCAGTGAPPVVLVSGYRNDADIWRTPLDPASSQTTVFAGVAAFTRVCAYDRPGTILDQTHVSRSDPVPMPRTAGAIVGELHGLILAAGIATPFVLAAHSLGGLFARLYAAAYPDDVAGIVLVDAWPEQMPTLLGPAQWAAYERLAGPPPPGLEHYCDLEMVDFGAASATMRQAAAAHPWRRMPLVVLSRAKPVALPPSVPADFSPAAFEAAWRAGQNQLAALEPDARHVIAAASDHYIQLEQPDLVIAAIGKVVEAVRDPSSWAAPVVGPADATPVTAGT